MTNWLTFWDDKAMQQNTMAQVGRTIDGKQISNDVLAQIAQHIVSTLEIKNTDDVLDVCCGNGALSYLVANNCNSLTGIDFSNALLDIAANKHADIHIKYFKADALNFSLNTTFDKIYLYFSFQYFENLEDGKKVIENCINHLKPGGKLLIGDIPDKSKLFSFYNTPIKLLSLAKQQLTNQNTMGKFWSKASLDQICKELNVGSNLIKQEDWQPYHHYRFDYLITK